MVVQLYKTPGRRRSSSGNPTPRGPWGGVHGGTPAQTSTNNSKNATTAGRQAGHPCAMPRIHTVPFAAAPPPPRASPLHHHRKQAPGKTPHHRPMIVLRPKAGQGGARHCRHPQSVCRGSGEGGRPAGRKFIPAKPPKTLKP